MDKEEAIKFLQQLYPYGGHCWLDKQRTEAIGMAIQALQEEPVSNVWHNEDEEPQKDSLILLIMQSGTPIVAKIIEPNHTFNHGERWAYIDDLLKL